MTLLLFVIVVVLILILYWLLQSKGKRYKPEPKRQLPTGRQPVRIAGIDMTGSPEYDPTEDLLLMPMPGTTFSDIQTYLNNNYPELAKNLPERIKFICHSCDNTLFKIDGLSALTVKPSTEGPPNGSNPTKPVGEGSLGPLFVSPNYKFNLRDKKTGNCDGVLEGSPLHHSPKDEKVLVAVLDTGLDKPIADAYSPGPVSHCAGTLGTTGYNVVCNNNDTKDDFEIRDENDRVISTNHGTPVAGLILRSAAAASAEVPVDVRILPVKVLNKHGEGTLEQLMCGLAYAKNAGARIINTSLGFYAAHESQVSFFKTFVERMTADNTLIITAAGNVEEQQQQTMVSEKLVAEGTDLRNLENNPFYPASFSQTNQNVIAVTTVCEDEDEKYATAGSLEVADSQNYSHQCVQVGVKGDKEKYFMDPFGPKGANWASWNGSSFATPVFTGLVAATYRAYLDRKDGNYNRADYLHWLYDNGYLTTYPQQGDAIINPEVPNMLLINTAPGTYVSLQTALQQAEMV